LYTVYYSNSIGLVLPPLRIDPIYPPIPLLKYELYFLYFPQLKSTELPLSSDGYNIIEENVNWKNYKDLLKSEDGKILISTQYFRVKLLNSGGKIEVKSALGKGTTLKVYFKG
jgi:hypothetical protein